MNNPIEEEAKKGAGENDSGSDDSLASTASNVFGGAEKEGAKINTSGEEQDVVSESDDEKEEQGGDDEKVQDRNAEECQVIHIRSVFPYNAQKSTKIG